jgi:hypothetical protein
MEDVMLGIKRTIQLWRPKRRLLSLGRALAPERHDSTTGATTAQAVAKARARQRMAAEARRKGRFSDA